MYAAMLDTPDRDFYDTSSLTLCASGGAALPVEVLRGFEAAFGCQVLEGYGLSETSPIASFNHAAPRAQAGLDRHPDRRRGDEADRCRRRRRRDRHPRPQRDEGLLEPPRGDRRGDRRRRLVQDRRHRHGRRRRLLLHRRPQEGPDHPRRLQRLPARDRGGPLRAPRRARGRRRRPAARRPGRGGRRRRRAQGRRRRRRRASCARSSRSRSPRTSTRATVWIVDELPKGPTGKILKREIELPVEVAL